MQDLPGFPAGVVLFDGGFGSQVAAKGLSFDCPERLNLTHPDDVRAVHRAYVEAGAQVIETNTLGANPIKLRAHGLSGEASAIVKAAVAHARAAGARIVACSMGTTGQFLAPFGPLSFKEAFEIFSVQAAAAAEAGADILFTETLTDLSEARAMWLAACEAGLPFAASFTFLENGRTLSGNPPEVCALTAEAMGASMVGVNCVSDPALLLRVIRAMRAVSRLPIVAQPNAGLPEEISGRHVYHVGPEDLLPTMAKVIEAGASAIGGCCGTTPAHIRAMARLAGSAKRPEAGGDGPVIICGPRMAVLLSDALQNHAVMQPDDIDSCDAAAVLLDLCGLSPEGAQDAVLEALTFLRQPFLFRADDPATLRAALQIYPGTAADDAGNVLFA